MLKDTVRRRRAFVAPAVLAAVFVAGLVTLSARQAHDPIRTKCNSYPWPTPGVSAQLMKKPCARWAIQTAAAVPIASAMAAARVQAPRNSISPPANCTTPDSTASG